MTRGNGTRRNRRRSRCSGNRSKKSTGRRVGVQVLNRVPVKSLHAIHGRHHGVRAGLRLALGAVRATHCGFIAAIVVVFFTAWHNVRHGEWGFSWPALAPGLWRAMAVTFAAVLVIIGAGAAAGTLHDRRDFLGSLAPLVLGEGRSSGCCKPSCCARLNARRLEPGYRRRRGDCSARSTSRIHCWCW